jgi:hypothetical protein
VLYNIIGRNILQFFKKLLCLPLLVALSQGCSGCTDVVDSGSSLMGLGFASDTTAILFCEQWENINSPSGFGQTGSGTNYIGWELKLVDIRFHKVYWESQISYGRGNTRILRGSQWNDSTMIIGLTGDGYWFWTVGNNKPQKINFNWNAKMEDYKDGELMLNTSGFRFRPWKNDSVLLFSDSKQAIVDSKTMTMNDWSTTEENVWTNSCDDFWWIKSGGVCFMDNPSHVTLLSEKLDTLGSFLYTDERIDYCDSRWAAVNIPSYWIFGKRNFVDSLRNIMGH